MMKTQWKTIKSLQLLFFVLGFIVLSFSPQKVSAEYCYQCLPVECELEGTTAVAIRAIHQSYVNTLINAVFGDPASIASGTASPSTLYGMHQQWMIETFFADNILRAMMMFTEQMSAIAMQQMLAIGMFFDAEHQMETQRELQYLQWQAHKDYQPSEDFCWFGTNARSLAASENRSRFNRQALNKIKMDRTMRREYISGAWGEDQDSYIRWQKFAKTYCNVKDNNWTGKSAITGLQLACDSPDPGRHNNDIDYTRMIEEPRSLDVAFFRGNGLPTEQEEDVIALSNNLYGHKPIPYVDREVMIYKEGQEAYLNVRTLAAKRSVATNSFNAIVGLKSFGSSDSPENAPDSETRKYLAALLVELGVPKEGEGAQDVYKIMGEHPSYYAQLELLAKKIYQNPDFYVGLYDKPANVARKGVAIKAIDLMLSREMFESQLRREMAISVLLSTKLEKQFGDIEGQIQAMNKK